MKLSLQEYKEILNVALDHQLRHFRGKFLLDDRDPAVEQDNILRAAIDTGVKQNNINKLQKLLRSLINSFFVVHDDYDFSQYLFDKTGYRITPTPKEYLSQSTRRTLYLSVSGKGESAITTIQILLPTTSGVIYSVRGSFPDIKAQWKEDNTIEIPLPEATEELERVSKVKYHGETINILYKDNIR